MKYTLFPKEARGTFKYWFYHWYAFNETAKELGVWQFHHLFHDIEKPFLRLFLPYEKVQKIHRRNNKHHLEYKKHHKYSFGEDDINWVDLVIDWECSHLTKIASWRTCIQEANFLIMTNDIDFSEYYKIITTARKLGLEE